MTYRASLSLNVKRYNKWAYEKQTGLIGSITNGIAIDTPDAWTFFDKSVLRPMRDKSWAILRGDIEGDQGWARKVLYDSAYYKDPQGHTQYSDNTNMVSGRAVQVYTDMLLVEDADVTEAYGEAINMLHGYEPPYWHDHDVDKAVLAHRENICYDAEGKKSKEPTMAEFSLVCENAASGIREAMSRQQSCCRRDRSIR